MLAVVLLVLISPISFALEPGKLYINDILIPFEEKVEKPKEPERASSTFYIYVNGQRIAKQEIDEDGNKELFYFYNDHLGSPRAISDDEGNIIWKADYLPFGEVFNEIGDNNVKYNSKELDLDTKLHYYGARYYLDDIGRFITADTVEMYPNAYVYVKNNPLKFVDPSGEQIYIGGNWRERQQLQSHLQQFFRNEYILEFEKVEKDIVKVKPIDKDFVSKKHPKTTTILKNLINQEKNKIIIAIVEDLRGLEGAFRPWIFEDYSGILLENNNLKGSTTVHEGTHALDYILNPELFNPFLVDIFGYNFEKIENSNKKGDEVVELYYKRKRLEQQANFAKEGFYGEYYPGTLEKMKKDEKLRDYWGGQKKVKWFPYNYLGEKLYEPIK